MSDGQNLKNHKVALLGDSGVGKTSIVIRYINDEFNQNVLATTGVSFLSKNIFFPETNESCKLDVIIII
jgi:Ras-related protein Rab-7A